MTKQHKRKRPRLHKIPHVKTLLFRRIEGLYLENSDDFQLTVELSINSTILKIQGILDPIYLVSDGVRLNSNTANPYFNCTELCLTRDNAPVFYRKIKNWYETIGDALDSDQPLPTLTLAYTPVSWTDNDLNTNLTLKTRPL